MTWTPLVVERFLQMLEHHWEYAGPLRVSPDGGPLGVKCFLICKHWIKFRKSVIK